MADFDWKAGARSFITVDGSRLECTCHGPGPNVAPTIIMLHEGLGSVSLWRDFPERIAAETGCGVFVYSRAGYGQSDPCSLPRPKHYMTDEAMDVLPVVLDAIGFRSGILFGHSDGATIAAIYGGLGGDQRVRGLVLMAPHFFGEEISLTSIQGAKVAYEKGDLREKLARHHADVDTAFRGWNDAWLNPEFADWNVADVIDYIRVPVLAIQGCDDEYGTLAQIGEIQNRIYAPLDVEIIDQCGHSPHREQPIKVLDMVTDFAKRLQRIEKVQVTIA